MTTEEFVNQYLALESKLDVADALKAVVQVQIDGIMADQASLATQHLDELTPLRDGQEIELALLNGFGNPDWNLPSVPMKIVEVQQVGLSDLDLIAQGDPSAPRSLQISVWAHYNRDPASLWELEAQPGNQWRYPADSTPAAQAAMQEVQS